ncbi:hypothetical protein NT04LM_3738, partial [Listeria monocytogenes FSL F2-208]
NTSFSLSYSHLVFLIVIPYKYYYNVLDLRWCVANVK